MRLAPAGVLLVGLLAAATHGPWGASVAGLGLVLFVAGRWGRADLSWWAQSLAGPLLAGLLGVVGMATAWSPPEVVAAFLVGLTVGCGLQRSDDERVLLLLTTLQVALASATGLAPRVGALLLAWTLFTSLSLFPLERRAWERWKGRAAPLIAVGLLAGVGFVFVPRWSPADLGGSASIGLGADVVLGGASSLVGGDELVLRVRPSPGFTARPLYLRGRIYDRFDGAVWSLAPDERAVAPAADGAHWLDLVQEGLADDMPLFTTGRVARLVGSEAAAVTVHGAWVLPGAPQRLAYRVWFEPGYESGSIGDPARWTDLPRLPAALLEDIADIGPGLEDPWTLAVAVRTELLARHAYTLAPQVARVDALTAFLVDDLPGHCGYFASAAVVILRSRGVPARLVTGFAGGEWHEATGEYLLRQRHAHAWVEVWDGQGWLRIDVTPGPPEGSVALASATGLAQWLTRQWFSALSWDVTQQQGALRWLGGGVPLVLVVGVALVGTSLLVGWRLRRREVTDRRARFVGHCLDRYRRRLERDGWVIPGHLPPVAAAEWVEARSEGGEAFVALSWLYYRCEYGGEAERDVSKEARRLAAAPLPMRRAGTERLGSPTV